MRSRRLQRLLRGKSEANFENKNKGWGKGESNKRRIEGAREKQAAVVAGAVPKSSM